jgi:hypothetical protein
VFHDPFEETLMAAESKDPKSPKTEADKKIPETVLLTADELRAISGGINTPSPPPVSSKVVVPGRDKPTQGA